MRFTCCASPILCFCKKEKRIPLCYLSIQQMHTCAPALALVAYASNTNFLGKKSTLSGLGVDLRRSQCRLIPYVGSTLDMYRYPPILLLRSWTEPWRVCERAAWQNDTLVCVLSHRPVLFPYRAFQSKKAYKQFNQNKRKKENGVTVSWSRFVNVVPTYQVYNIGGHISFFHWPEEELHGKHLLPSGHACPCSKLTWAFTHLSNLGFFSHLNFWLKLVE